MGLVNNASVQRRVDAASAGAFSAAVRVNYGLGVSIRSTCSRACAYLAPTPNNHAAAENVTKATAVELMMMRAMRPLSAP